jgi:putative transposase
MSPFIIHTGGFKVAKGKTRQNGNSKQLKAQDIYKLVSATLQEHFQLDMANRKYTAQDIWDVLVAASVERISIEMASQLIENAPSGTMVRTLVKDMLKEIGQLKAVESSVNDLLTMRLPRKLLKSKLPAAIDITELAYHGQHAQDDETVRRGRAKSGTTHFYAFATLYVVKKNKRYTLAVVLMRKSEKAQDVVARLLARGRGLNLRIKRLYLDRGFDNNGLVAYLKHQPFPTIIPLVIRGKHGGSRALLVGRKSYITTYKRKSTIYDQESLPLFIVCKYSKGKYKRKGVFYFAYIVIGSLKRQPAQIAEEYRRRFGIETSYRLMNTMRARTTCKIASFRLLLVALAFFLLNLWQYVKWTYLFVPKPGPRTILHRLLPLARWRLWLWEMLRQRLGFSLVIHIPLAA